MVEGIKLTVGARDMNGRNRSPSYPSTPLEEALEYIAKIHKVERLNSVDREVAAKAMGYSGISGRSATVLSNLIQYGLLEKSGKNEVRVSRRAVEILYPESEIAKSTALMAAAKEPELFQRVAARFTDGTPSANALEAFFVREGFTDTAIPAAVRAFRETFQFLQNANDSGSYLALAPEVIESQTKQQVESTAPMRTTQQTPSDNANLGRRAEVRPSLGQGAEVFVLQNHIQLGGAISSLKDADDLIKKINALKFIFNEVDQEEEKSSSSDSDGD